MQRDVSNRTHTFQASHPRPPYDLDTFSAPDVFMQIRAGDGTVTARSANLAGRTLPLPDAARRGQVAEVRLAGRPLFLAAARLPDRGYVVVARSPVTTYRALAALQRLLTAVVAAAMLLTALASWGYARTALRPIDRVVDAARAVRDRVRIVSGWVHQTALRASRRHRAAFRRLPSAADATGSGG
jgi:signal transduction histidine kinase